MSSASNQAETTTGRSRQKDLTRARLLEAAGRLVCAQGFLAFRTLDLARAAEVSHGTVFVHFPTREALLVALVEERLAAVLRSIHARLESGADIGTLLRQHLEGLAPHEELYSWLVREQSGLPQELADALAGVNSTLSWHLTQAAARGRAAGTIKDVPDHFLFNCWIGLVHHYLANPGHFAPGASVIQTRGEELVRNFMNIISR